MNTQCCCVFPEQFKQIAAYEKEFGKTIDRNAINVSTKTSMGKAYPACRNAALVAEARDENWNGRIILDEGEWGRLAYIRQSPKNAPVPVGILIPTLYTGRQRTRVA